MIRTTFVSLTIYAEEQVDTWPSAAYTEEEGEDTEDMDDLAPEEESIH